MSNPKMFAQWILDNQDKQGTEDFNLVAQAFEKSLQDEQVLQQPEEKPFGVAEYAQAPLELGKAVTRGLGGALLSSAAGLAELADVATDRLGFEDLIDSGEDNELIRLANAGQEALQENLGASEPYRDLWFTKFGEGVGSIGSFFLPTGILGAAGRAAGLAAKTTRGLQTAGAGTTAVGLGAEEQASRIEQARLRGVEISEDQEDASIVGGGFVGISEIATPLSILKKIRKLKDPKLNDQAFDAIRSAIKTGTVEGVQEVTASLMQDAIQYGIYDENVPFGESMWDDFTIGAASGALVDAITTGMFNRRSRLSREIELDREKLIREEEERQREEYYNKVALAEESLKERDIQSQLTAIAAQEDAELAAADALNYQVEQSEQEALLGLTAPYQPSQEALRQPKGDIEGRDIESTVTKQGREYARQIARNASKKTGLFPSTGRFEIREEQGGPSGTNYVVYNTADGRQYGQATKDLEFAKHFSLGLNNEMINKSVNESIIDAMDMSPEAYDPKTAESIFMIGQRLNRPKSYTISEATLNEAAGTVASKDKPFLEDLTLDQIHQIQYGVPPFQDGKKKLYKDLKNLTASQQINFERAKKGLPPLREFTLQEAKDALGNKYDKVFDVLLDVQQPDLVAIRQEFGEAGVNVQGGRQRYQDEINTLKEVKDTLASKNIVSDIGSKELSYVFKKITGESSVNKMTPSQRMFLVGELKRLPALDKPSKLPDLSPKPYTRADFNNAMNYVISTGDGTVDNIKAVLPEGLSEKRKSVAAGQIRAELLSRGVINKDNTVSELTALPAPEPRKPTEVTEKDFTVEQSVEALDFQKKLSERLKGMGLDDIRVRILDQMKTAPDITREGRVVSLRDRGDFSAAEGLFDTGSRTIFLGLDSARASARDQSPEAIDFALSEVMDHEIVHALRNLDLWTQKEFSLLENAARKLKMPGTNKTFYQDAVERYVTQQRGAQKRSPVQAMEEAIAEMIRYSKKDRKIIGGKPRNLIDRIFEFFRRLGSAMQGTGFNSMNDLINDIESGALGARERGVVRTARGMETARRAVPERGIGLARDVKTEFTTRTEVTGRDGSSATTTVTRDRPVVGEDDIQEAKMTYSENFLGLSQWANDNFALSGGFRDGSSSPGEARLRYDIYNIPMAKEKGPEAAKIGYTVLRVRDTDGAILGLIDIKLDKEYRDSGYGRQVVQDIVDSTESGLDVHDIKRSAQKFWSKMGTEFKDRLKKEGRISKDFGQPVEGGVQMSINRIIGRNGIELNQAPDGKTAHGLPSELLVDGPKQKARSIVVQNFTPQNTDQVLSNIQTVKSNNPDALGSTENWIAMEDDAFGGDFVPIPPLKAIQYAQSPELLAEKLKQLTPELKAGVDEGFKYVQQIKNLYNTQSTSPDLTGRLFMWGLLSRGAGPVQQEFAFLNLLESATPYIKKASEGKMTQADVIKWKRLVGKSIPSGSPAKSVTMNANDIGKLLFELGKVPEGSSQTVMQTLHNMLADSNVSGKEFRNEFFRLTNKPGVDNKVVSFIALVAGKDDVLVMDRIQGRHLWNDGRFSDKNIYDGLKKGKVKGGLNAIFAGPRGLLVTESLEDGLSPVVQQAYAMIGRPQDASVGRMHWETWVIDGNQAVSHSTLEAVRTGSGIGGSVTEGKRGTFSSGTTYRQTANGPITEYPLSDGTVARMTLDQQKEFEAFIKNPKNGIIPKGFLVGRSKDRPWFELPEVNREKLDEAARRFENANPDGSIRSGNARSIQAGASDAGRRRAAAGPVGSVEAPATDEISLSLKRLDGMPESFDVNGQAVEFGYFEPAVTAAKRYTERSGRVYEPLTEYAPINEDVARKIAAEFEIMEHRPDDPEVMAAYDAMIEETKDQYRDILDSGLKVQFIKGEDPYGNPRNVILDVVNNNHMWVFSTVDGFGSDADLDVSDNPLLQATEFETADGDPMLANDVFRVVHDYFGHIKNGVGFRARGEENAWQAHAAMYSPLARRAMTTETRGQNSYVNFGPNRDFNLTANGADTVYADQKVGLLPLWVSEEARLSDPRRRDGRIFQEGLQGAIRDDGKVSLTHYSRGKINRTDPSLAGRGLDRSRRYSPKGTYFGITEAVDDGYRKEAGLGPVENKFSVDPVLLYPLAKDHLGLVERYPAGNMDYDATIQNLKDNGFIGFWNNSTYGKAAFIFEPLIADNAAPRVMGVDQDGGIKESIKAYHASPYRFKEFDITKIGTGTGSQFYGYGFNFTDSIDVARGYKYDLSESTSPDEDDISFDVEAYLGEDIQDYASSRAEVTKFDRGTYKYIFEDGSRGYLDQNDEFVAEGKPTSVIYSVDINVNPEELLEWDKPLSDQSSKVLNAIRKNKSLIREKLYLRDQLNFDDFLKAQTGKSFYEKVSTELKGSEKASQFLNSLGVKGVKFETGTFSREDTTDSNYTIFDPSSVSINEIVESLKRVDGIIERNPAESITRIYDESATRPFLEEQEINGYPPFSWQAKTYSRGDKIIYQAADKLVGLKKAEEEINRARALAGLPPIKNKDSAYVGEESIPGKIGIEVKDFQENVQRPYAKKIADSGIPIEELDEFLTFRHAVERNNRIQLRDPSRNVETNPGSGSLKTGERLSNFYVKQIMENRYGYKWDDASESWVGGNDRGKKLMDLAADADSIVNSTIDRMIKGGLLSKDNAEALRGLYKYYAPLKGKAQEDDFADFVAVGSGLNTKGKEFQRAFGRESASESPLGHIMLNAERTIARSVKNENFGQKLVNLIKDNPNGDFWNVYDATDPRFKQAADTYYTYVGRDAGMQGQRFKEIPRDMNSRDFVKYTVIKQDGLAKFDGDLIGAKIDGKEYFIEIKDDRLRRAIQSVNAGEADNLIRKFSMVNRFLSMMNTSLNPEFVIGNFSRDLQTAIYNIVGEQTMQGGKIKDVKRITRRVLKDVIPSMGIVYKGMRRYNMKDGTVRSNITGLSEADYLDFREFMESGAKADWFYTRPAEEQVQTIQSMVDMANGTFTGNFRKGYEGVMNFVEDANGSVENAVRFATFKAARDELLNSGVDRAEAVATASTLAKNLTVNFNRKGMQGDLLNALYLFYNASVQGTMNFARGLNVFDPGSSRTKQAMVASMIGFGALMAARGEEESEENPDSGRSYYSEIPDYIKERNIVIMAEPSEAPKKGANNIYLDKNGKEYANKAQYYYTIPLPYGYNVFHVAGVKLFEMKNDLISVEKASGDLLSAFLGSFSPIGFFPLPTITQPFWELAKNENYFGSPIYKENFPTGVQSPASQLAMSTTRTPFKNAAKILNSLTGGNEYESGYMDVSPDALEHIAEFALGGAGTFGLRNINAFEKWMAGEELESREVPFLRRVMGEPDKNIAVADYYDRKVKLEQKEAAIQGLRGADRIKYRERNQDYVTMFGVLNSIERKLRKIRQMESQLRSRAALSPANAEQYATGLEVLEERKQKLYDQFNNLYDKRVGRTK